MAFLVLLRSEGYRGSVQVEFSSLRTPRWTARTRRVVRKSWMNCYSSSTRFQRRSTDRRRCFRCVVVETYMWSVSRVDVGYGSSSCLHIGKDDPRFDLIPDSCQLTRHARPKDIAPTRSKYALSVATFGSKIDDRAGISAFEYRALYEHELSALLLVAVSKSCGCSTHMVLQARQSAMATPSPTLMIILRRP